MAEGERKDPIAKLKFLQIYSLLITPSGEEGATSSKFFDNSADLVLLLLFKDHFAPSPRCFLDYTHRDEGKLKSFLSFHLESFSSAKKSPPLSLCSSLYVAHALCLFQMQKIHHIARSLRDLQGVEGGGEEVRFIAQFVREMRAVENFQTQT